MGDKSSISKNSQKLFNYLVCLGGNPPNTQRRVFQHKNINLSLISRTIGISFNSIKKYWFELETNNKIIYGNGMSLPDNELKERKELCDNIYQKDWYSLNKKEQFEIWKKLWANRKKNPCEYYTICAGPKTRNIPEETLRILNEEIQCSEQDMKLYQFLLTYREIGIKKMYKKFDFSMEDLRSFLNKKKETKTHLSIYKSLLFLQRYGLIEFEEVWETNVKGARIKHYILTNVNFYVNEKYRNSTEEERKLIQEDTQKEIEEVMKEQENI